VINVIIIVFELVDQLISCQKSEDFGILAKGTHDYWRKALKVDCIEQVEVVVLVVANLINAIFVYYYHCAET
jgi:hypothetical protein